MKRMLCMVASGLAAAVMADVSIVTKQDEGLNVVGGASGTATFSTVTAQAGDVIVMSLSGNKKGNVISFTANQVGGTGTLGALTREHNDLNTYPTSWVLYQPVTSAGTFHMELATETTAGISASTALYVLRSDTGSIEVAGTATWDDVNDAANPATHALNYTFSEAVVNGVLIESISARSDGLEEASGTYARDRSAAPVDDGYKRAVYSKAGVNGATWTSTYNVHDDEVRKTSGGVGVVFRSATGGGGGEPGEIAPNHPALVWKGSNYVTADANGAAIQRHSDAVLALSTTEKGFNTQKAKTTTGVSLCFKTDSDAVTVKFTHDLAETIENRNSRFGVYEDGTFVDSYYFAKTESNLTFTVNSATPGTPSEFRIALPNWSKPDFRGLTLDADAALMNLDAPAKKSFVVFGDSISHGTGQGASYQTWPWIAAELLDVDLVNLAVGGGKVSVPAAEMLAEFPAVDVIAVLIGYNDLHGGAKTKEQFAADLNAMLDAARANQPAAKLFCVSPLFTTNPTNDTTGETIQEFRQVVYDEVANRQAAGDGRIYLARGEDLTTAADLNDAVHLSEPGAARFATNLVAVMDPIVNPPKPNVLFIAIDDINPIMGCYGNDLIQTPHMDSLASRGMVFENAHCQWAVCGPSRASLMVGLMPEQTGVTGFRKMRGASDMSSRDNAKGLTNLVTIPQHFIAHGYATAASGKINDNRCVGSINPDGTINEDGGTVDDPPSWSHGFLNPGGVSPSTAPHPTDAGKTVKRAAESVDQPGENFIDGAIATAGLSQLESLTNSQPFFLGVGFKKPHLPFLAPADNWDQYDRDDFTPHPFQEEMKNVTEFTFNSIKEMRDNYYLETDGNGKAIRITDDILPVEQQKELLHGYYACISHVDDQVGRLLTRLDELGLTSNTIVVLWGDHGFHLGDHNEWGKHTNLEQATRVPFIISAPGFAPGKTMAPVGLLDIYPTLCELAGLPIPEQPTSHANSGGRPLAGNSIVPILVNPDARVQTGVMNHYGGNVYGYAYRTERYRYTEWIDSSGTIRARELYDYVEDPMETVNLAVYPEYEALMRQFSVGARSDGEAGGCDRLKASEPAPDPANKTLPGLKLSGGELSWPDAAGGAYTILSKTNLTDVAWTTSHVNLAASPVALPLREEQEFYRVEIAN